MRRSRVAAPQVAPLREIAGSAAPPGPIHRRWFTSPTADLYVWLDGERITAFELCYGKPADEHVFRWREAAGADHARIDDGEATPLRNDTPIAVPDGRYDAAAVALAFEAAAAELEPRIVRFVLRELHRAG